MGKVGKTVSEVQDRVLSQFERDIRSYERRDRELSISERLILESQQRKTAQEQRLKTANEKPRISFYNPNNILNRIKHLSPEDQKIALKQHLKEQKDLIG